MTDPATQAGDLARHLDDLGARLAESERRADRRRRRVLRAAAATSIACIALAVGLGGLVGLPGGQRLDPVERARAALAESGGILHWVVVPTTIGPSGRRNAVAGGGAPPATEVWTEAGGDEFRVRQPADGRPRLCGGSGYYALSAAGDVVATLIDPLESASTAKTRSVYSPWSREVVVLTRPAAQPADAETGPTSSLVRGLTEDDPRDPLRTIRTALERGQLRDGGTVERDGRTLRRLVGEGERRPPTYVTGVKVDQRTGRSEPRTGRDRQKVQVPPDQLTYLVDPLTFAPVETRIRRKMFWLRTGSGVAGEWTTEVSRFSLFERLPDTPANRRLLAIDPPPGTRTSTFPDTSDVPAPRLPGRIPPVDDAAVRRCKAARNAPPTP